MRSSLKIFRWFAAMLAVVLLAGAFAAAEEDPPAGETVELAFWTTEVERDRMDLQRELAKEFSLEHPGIQVRIVPVREQDLDRKLMAAAAADALPDVVRIGLEYVKGYADAAIISSAAATELIESLGVDTFFAGALAASPYRVLYFDRVFQTVAGDLDPSKQAELLRYRRLQAQVRGTVGS